MATGLSFLGVKTIKLYLDYRGIDTCVDELSSRTKLCGEFASTTPEINLGFSTQLSGDLLHGGIKRVGAIQKHIKSRVVRCGLFYHLRR